MEDPTTMADAEGWILVVETMTAQDWTERLRVDTGWIYARSVLAGATTDFAGQITVAMVFVPDRATP